MRHNAMETGSSRFSRFLVNRRWNDLSLMVDATTRCQLNCRYCYFGPKTTKTMDSTAVFSGIKALAGVFKERLRSVNVHYMGGEPLLGWEEIVQLNAKARSYFLAKGIPFRWSLTSNLVNLTKEMAEFMIAERAGIHCSVDGPMSIHDRNRPFRDGRGSFDDVIRAIPLALKISPDDTARVTVCPENAGDLSIIAEFVLGAGFRRVGLFPAFNMAWDGESINLWARSMAVAYERVYERH